MRLLLALVLSLGIAASASAQIGAPAGAQYIRPSDVYKMSMNVFVGKTVCLRIAQDSWANGSASDMCTTVRGVRRFFANPNPDNMQYVELQFEPVVYWAHVDSMIISIVPDGEIGKDRWVAMIEFHDGQGLTKRGATVDEVLIFR